jgi:hypothetical protein
MAMTLRPDVKKFPALTFAGSCHSLLRPANRPLIQISQALSHDTSTRTPLGSSNSTEARTHTASFAPGFFDDQIHCGTAGAARGDETTVRAASSGARRAVRGMAADFV